MDVRTTIKNIAAEKGRVAVIGAGISGIESVKFFRRCGIRTVLIERAKREALLAKSKFTSELLKLETQDSELVFGLDGEELAPFLEDVRLCVLSPGVSLEAPAVAAMLRRGVPLISELELGIALRGGDVVAVTGSNGKSTTVSLIDHALRAASIETFLCGNVGTPVVAGLDSAALDPALCAKAVQVVEASSYQLETCRLLKPKVAALLNISDNHLERHGTLERYLACKAKIFAAQDSTDWALLNLDDQHVAALAPKLKAQVLGVSFESKSIERKGGALIEYLPERGVDRIRLRIAGQEEEYQLAGAKLIGRHNRIDLAFAGLASRLLGASSEVTAQALLSFAPLAHRLEILPAPGSRIFVNDSKSTTVAATQAAVAAVLERYPGKRVLLMLGGLSKAGSWHGLMSAIKSEHSRFLPIVCFGKDARIIADHCKADGLPCRIVPDVAAAVNLAFESSAPGEVALFSPGCASFDQFRDFEERGEYVRALLSEGQAAVSSP